ncbi:MAG: TPM domain-containing protein [Thiolinea sp.]
MYAQHRGGGLRLVGWLVLSCWLLLNVNAAFAQTTARPVASFSLNAPVIDQSKTLSAAEIASLDQQLRAIHEAGRAQIAIVLVPSTGDESTFDAAMRMAETWKLGTAQRDNGLLIFVAVHDRRVQILTGYGLESILPDVITSRIIREELTPSFREGEYALGLKAAVIRIDQILQMDPEAAKAQATQAQDQAHQAQENPLSSMFGIGIFLFVLGQFARSILGRFIGSVAVGGLALVLGFWLGWPWLMTGIMALALVFLEFTMAGSGSGGRQGRGGVIYPGSGGTGGWSGGRSSGGGGYSGGGGGFGGGGASGSW